AVSRTFSYYDGLPELEVPTNREAGAVQYSYDANGNVSSKTDARGVTTGYQYDALNRLTSKSYSNGTPSSCYQYDVSTVNGIGRLANEWTIAPSQSCSSTGPSSGMTLRSFSQYDPMGRVWSEQQCGPSGCQAATPCQSADGQYHSYSYDLAGHLTCSTNGMTSTPGLGSVYFTSTFDGAGRLQTLGSSSTAFPSNLFTVGSVNGYAPTGQLQNWTQGPNLSITQSYTNRVWLSGITATGQVPQ